MELPHPHRHDDVNAVVGDYLRDLAMAQEIRAKMFGYKRAARRDAQFSATHSDPEDTR